MELLKFNSILKLKIRSEVRNNNRFKLDQFKYSDYNRILFSFQSLITLIFFENCSLKIKYNISSLKQRNLQQCRLVIDKLTQQQGQPR